MITVEIDGKQLEAQEGQTILEVAREAGIKIPTLCYHKELTPYGACRLCLVEITGGGRPSVQASCLYRVTDGLQVRTDTERVISARKMMFELLLARSPDSEKLQQMAAEYGITQTRLALKEQDRCILCGLCQRACAEVSERHAINFSGRGPRRRIQTPFYEISETCIGCTACSYVCPTGAIEIKEAE